MQPVADSCCLTNALQELQAHQLPLVTAVQALPATAAASLPPHVQQVQPSQRQPPPQQAAYAPLPPHLLFSQQGCLAYPQGQQQQQQLVPAVGAGALPVPQGLGVAQVAPLGGPQVPGAVQYGMPGVAAPGPPLVYVAQQPALQAQAPPPVQQQHSMIYVPPGGQQFVVGGGVAGYVQPQAAQQQPVYIFRL